jgi:hypothetical protein
MAREYFSGGRGHVFVLVTGAGHFAKMPRKWRAHAPRYRSRAIEVKMTSRISGFALRQGVRVVANNSFGAEVGLPEQQRKVGRERMA